MENWDLYNIHRNTLNKTMVRGEDIPKDTYHIVVHVCIFNSKGQMLIQQRQSNKESWPNYWDVSCGGSAIAGDTSQLAASRELAEELGIDYDFNGIRPQLTFNSPAAFDDYYLVELDVNSDNLTIQAEEVQAVRWATKQEILELIEQGKFVTYYKGLIDMIFSMRMNYGTKER